MIYNIGIDISKYKHDFCIISNTGEIIVDNKTFQNNQKGFQQFLDTLKSYDKSNVHIAFEATGHYTMNLEHFLLNNDYTFIKFNPLIIKEFMKSQSLRKTKTDKADAIIICQKLMSIPYVPNSSKLYHISSLKSLCRLRDSYIRNRTKIMIQITNILDITFPEYKPFFNNKISTTFIYILDKYKNIEHITLMKDFDSISNISRGRFSYAQFTKLKQLAKESVGYHNDDLDYILNSSISIYNDLNKEIDLIESKISTIIKELNPHMLTIPGIGDITAAIILSEFEDISKFSSPDKMLAFAGLEPGIIQSGTLEFQGKMVKRGSSMLRFTLMNAARSVVRYNSTFYDYYYEKHYNQNKPYRVALSHVCKKLVRVIYTLETKHIDFDSSLLK